ncbi:hypothetical protein BABINDRAFT_158814 [Babjeviella inositovora NRRL Y-12698]|uniref:Uncharacterized protein n=1 Tax=Babjeviella inositovora NRRL Y-12698 TaxID=984486 RepID=A0A1E3QWV3_9ASCO|nr:uncharacterized protein BABINDRAFT_158814 [Babjeviella inositovora NRRL Y-12698]ODQ82163.1 hypothetical protein BABINDRAFT_158814 [Babjeviella inositovora NRRL Y-12698]
MKFSPARCTNTLHEDSLESKCTQDVDAPGIKIDPRFATLSRTPAIRPTLVM